MDNLNRLKTILSEMDDLFLPIEPENIDPKHTLVSDLGIDSLTRTAILFEIQDQCNAKIDPSTASNWNTINDILLTLEKEK